jgi:hypothetical protein
MAQNLLLTVTEWAHKASLTLQPFLMCCASPSEFQSFLIHPPEFSGSYQQRHLVVKQEKFGNEMT